MRAAPPVGAEWRPARSPAPCALQRREPVRSPRVDTDSGWTRPNSSAGPHPAVPSAPPESGRGRTPYARRCRAAACGSRRRNRTDSAMSARSKSWSEGAPETDRGRSTRQHSARRRLEERTSAMWVTSGVHRSWMESKQAWRRLRVTNHLDWFRPDELWEGASLSGPLRRLEFCPAEAKWS